MPATFAVVVLRVPLAVPEGASDFTRGLEAATAVRALDLELKLVDGVIVTGQKIPHGVTATTRVEVVNDPDATERFPVTDEMCAAVFEAWLGARSNPGGDDLQRCARAAATAVVRLIERST